MHSDDDQVPARDQTWGQRHGLSIMIAGFFGLFAFVIALQVAC
jgi:hypothetical protein